MIQQEIQENTNYEKEFVLYEQALALKELGFDEPFKIFDQAIVFRNKGICMANEYALEYFDFYDDEVISAPLYQQVFRWFREKYGLCSWIERMYTADSICYYRYTCEYKKDPSSKTHEVILSIKEYNTYEEAELACLKKLIEIVKQQP